MDNSKTTRELALEWWNTQLSTGIKSTLIDIYFNSRVSNSLTGREIEEIWSCELGKAKMIQNANSSKVKNTYTREEIEALLLQCAEYWGVSSKEDIKAHNQWVKENL